MLRTCVFHTSYKVTLMPPRLSTLCLLSIFFAAHSAYAATPKHKPFQGNVHRLPGVVETEHYDEGPAGVAYSDVDEINRGAPYRDNTQVDIEKRPDASNGHGIGWVRASEWLVYTVIVTTAGNYALDIPVASKHSGGTFHIEFDGKDVSGPIAIPDTGGWDKLQTLNLKAIKLKKGRQAMKLVMDKNGENGAIGDIDLVRFTKE